MATLLKIENLKAAYGGIHALRGVSLEVEEGEIVSVLGANGAGKSTLLKCISAIMKRTDGTIEFDGKPISIRPMRSGTPAWFRFRRPGRSSPSSPWKRTCVSARATARTPTASKRTLSACTRCSPV